MPVAPSARAQATKQLSEDQRELLRIGDLLKLRRQDYAVELGITPPRLATYLSGRTASVPAEILDRARQLVAGGEESIRRREHLLARPMSETVGEWMDRLGVDTDVELARLLGLNPATVARWIKDQTKLDATALVRYEGFVEELAKRLSPPVPADGR